MMARRAVRLRKGNAETARRTYRRNGRSVLLIGVAHIAEKQFWDELNNFIPTLGYDVHFEGIGKPKTSTKIGGYAEVADFIGLLDQGRGLNYDPTWRRTDLTFAEISEALGAKRMDRMERDAAELADIKESGFSTRTLRKVLVVVLSFMPILPNRVILDRRNGIAVKHIEDSANDVCAIWGAAHLPGIERKLRANGWKRAEESWHVTITTEPQVDVH